MAPCYPSMIPYYSFSEKKEGAISLYFLEICSFHSNCDLSTFNLLKKKLFLKTKTFLLILFFYYYKIFAMSHIYHRNAVLGITDSYANPLVIPKHFYLIPKHFYT